LKDHPEITFVDRGLVKDIQLGEGTDDHKVTWRSRDGKASGTVRSRWVIDCSGRARLLVKKFGHDVPLDDGFSTSAVWGQFSGCTDDIFDERWNYTFPDGEVTRRDLDTIHLWGDGYWIWLIRLTGQRISVGVSFNRNRPPAEGNLRQVFWDVIRRYPLLNFLTEENQLDFAAYRNVQHISDTYVAARRYAIAGDAASIIDAYYSQGVSLALVTSWHAANIVERHLREHVLD
ncbi:NAD(P)/FAD-dependent oxidoreductase, partial [Streptomyces beijiangensis]